MEEKPISMELPNNIECTIDSTDAVQLKIKLRLRPINQQY